MNRRFFLSAGLLTVAAGGYVYLGRSGSVPDGGNSLLAGMANAQSEDVDKSLVVEMRLGNPDAAVTVIEYASFTCPHCRNFHQTAFKDLKANYIDTGKINFIYREVYFDRFGLWAGMLARCGGEERYFGIADLIYETQSEWTKGSDPAEIANNLRRLGRTAGLGDEEVNACLGNGEMARAMVAVYQENAERDGINSTPTFLINGDKFSNMPYEDFARELDSRL